MSVASSYQPGREIRRHIVKRGFTNAVCVWRSNKKATVGLLPLPLEKANSARNIFDLLRALAADSPQPGLLPRSQLFPESENIRAQRSRHLTVSCLGEFLGENEQPRAWAGDTIVSKGENGFVQTGPFEPL